MEVNDPDSPGRCRELCGFNSYPKEKCVVDKLSTFQGKGNTRDFDRDDAMTAVTGATSDFAYSIESSEDLENVTGYRCARFAGPLTTGIVGLFAFLSPIAMITLPKLEFMKWQISPCAANCQAVLVSLGWRLLLLLFASYLLFFRKPRMLMPRIFVFRGLIVFLIFVLTFTYWLFFTVRVYSTFGRNLEQEVLYEDVAVFCLSFAEVLMFVHYLAVILIEIRQLETLFVVKITRSPDGASQSYSVGRLSIQRLAVWCLEQYQRDFEVYNPYLEALPHLSTALVNSYKSYSVESQTAVDDSKLKPQGQVPVLGMPHRGEGHNERYHEELYYEHKVARRRARLLTAAEDAFTMVQRVQPGEKVSSEKSCDDMVQSVFLQLERPLDRYLRVTRQKLWYSKEAILEHIELSINHALSAKAFLEPYLKQASLAINKEYDSQTQTWTILCDHIVSQSAENGTRFQLRKGGVSLCVLVRQLPNLRFLVEPSRTSDTFVLRSDGEASV